MNDTFENGWEAVVKEFFTDGKESRETIELFRKKCEELKTSNEILEKRYLELLQVTEKFLKEIE